MSVVLKSKRELLIFLGFETKNRSSNTWRVVRTTLYVFAETEIKRNGSTRSRHIDAWDR